MSSINDDRTEDYPGSALQGLAIELDKELHRDTSVTTSTIIISPFHEITSSQLPLAAGFPVSLTTYRSRLRDKLSDACGSSNTSKFFADKHGRPQTSSSRGSCIYTTVEEAGDEACPVKWDINASRS